MCSLEPTSGSLCNLLSSQLWLGPGGTEDISFPGVKVSDMGLGSVILKLLAGGLQGAPVHILDSLMSVLYPGKNSIEGDMKAINSDMTISTSV